MVLKNHSGGRPNSATLLPSRNNDVYMNDAVSSLLETYEKSLKKKQEIPRHVGGIWDSYDGMDTTESSASEIPRASSWNKTEVSNLKDSYKFSKERKENIPSHSRPGVVQFPDDIWGKDVMDTSGSYSNSSAVDERPCTKIKKDNEHSISKDALGLIRKKQPTIPHAEQLKKKNSDDETSADRSKRHKSNSNIETNPSIFKKDMPSNVIDKSQKSSSEFILDLLKKRSLEATLKNDTLSSEKGSISLDIFQDSQPSSLKVLPEGIPPCAKSPRVAMSHIIYPTPQQSSNRKALVTEGVEKTDKPITEMTTNVIIKSQKSSSEIILDLLKKRTLEATLKNNTLSNEKGSVSLNISQESQLGSYRKSIVTEGVEKNNKPITEMIKANDIKTNSGESYQNEIEALERVSSIFKRLPVNLLSKISFAEEVEHLNRICGILKKLEGFAPNRAILPGSVEEQKSCDQSKAGEAVSFLVKNEIHCAESHSDLSFSLDGRSSKSESKDSMNATSGHHQGTSPVQYILPSTPIEAPLPFEATLEPSSLKHKVDKAPGETTMSNPKPANEITTSKAVDILSTAMATSVPGDQMPVLKIKDPEQNEKVIFSRQFSRNMPPRYAKMYMNGLETKESTTEKNAKVQHSPHADSLPINLAQPLEDLQFYPQAIAPKRPVTCNEWWGYNPMESSYDKYPIEKAAVVPNNSHRPSTANEWWGYNPMENSYDEYPIEKAAVVPNNSQQPLNKVQYSPREAVALKVQCSSNAALSPNNPQLAVSNVQYSPPVALAPNNYEMPQPRPILPWRNKHRSDSLESQIGRSNAKVSQRSEGILSWRNRDNIGDNSKYERQDRAKSRSPPLRTETVTHKTNNVERSSGNWRDRPAKVTPSDKCSDKSNNLNLNPEKVSPGRSHNFSQKNNDLNLYQKDPGRSQNTSQKSDLNLDPEKTVPGRSQNCSQKSDLNLDPEKAVPGRSQNCSQKSDLNLDPEKAVPGRSQNTSQKSDLNLDPEKTVPVRSQNCSQKSDLNLNSDKVVPGRSQNISRKSNNNLNFDQEEKVLNGRTRRNSGLAKPCNIVDEMIILKVFGEKRNLIDELMVPENELASAKRKYPKLLDILPLVNTQDFELDFSAEALKVFLRGIFSKSFTLPNWETALEVFVLAKKCQVSKLQDDCQTYFDLKPILPRQVQVIANLAKTFQISQVLQTSKMFAKVCQSVKMSDSIIPPPYNIPHCFLSCMIFVEPKAFDIPLYYIKDRGLGSTIQSDIQNDIKFLSLSGTFCITGFQIKLEAENSDVEKELNIYYDVYKGNDRVFGEDRERSLRQMIIISFKQKLLVKAKEEVRISVLIEDLCLRLCHCFQQEEVRHVCATGSFEISLKSAKKTLFFIEKIFYTFEG